MDGRNFDVGNREQIRAIALDAAVRSYQMLGRMGSLLEVAKEYERYILGQDAEPAIAKPTLPAPSPSKPQDPPQGDDLDPLDPPESGSPNTGSPPSLRQAASGKK